MNRLPMLCVAAALASAVFPAGAQEDAKARNWAVACNACHGTDGRSEGGMPPIAGSDAAAMQRVMLEFREGKRPATVMHQIAKGYSNDELRRIAEYFSKQKQ